MVLSDELALRVPIKFLAHEAILSIYYTASRVKKCADDFFRPYGLTDVQFNVMMLLKYQCEGEQGLSQVQLSDMMLVNRANITSLIDRMEKAELVKRMPSRQDRRFNIVCLTEKGMDLLTGIEPGYVREVESTVATLSVEEQRVLINLLGRIRASIAASTQKEI